MAAGERARATSPLGDADRPHASGGRQYDCLNVISATGLAGDISLNRHGTLHVLARFDDRGEPQWSATWDDYLRADPRTFLHGLESAAGLPKPSAVPASTTTSLTYRVLAALTATAIKTVEPIEVGLA